MQYLLKDNRTNGTTPCLTTLTIKENIGELIFTFLAMHTKYYCPYDTYNAIHAEGDACEIFIGSSKNRDTYYEIEVSPDNRVMLAKVTYCGINESDGKPILKHEFVAEEDCFVESKVTKVPNGYGVEIKIPKSKILTGDGEIYFNAYRVESDGGEMDKYLIALNPTVSNTYHSPDAFVWLKDYVR